MPLMAVGSRCSAITESYPETTAVLGSRLPALDTTDTHAPGVGLRPVDVAGADFREFPGTDDFRAGVMLLLSGMAVNYYAAPQNFNSEASAAHTVFWLLMPWQNQGIKA